MTAILTVDQFHDLYVNINNVLAGRTDYKTFVEVNDRQYIGTAMGTSDYQTPYKSIFMFDGRSGDRVWLIQYHYKKMSFEGDTDRIVTDLTTFKMKYL